MCVCVRARACVRACVRAYVRACVCVCVCVCVTVPPYIALRTLPWSEHRYYSSVPGLETSVFHTPVRVMPEVINKS